MSGLTDTGWQLFEPEPDLLDWARHAHRDAMRAVADPALAQWHQCEGTWFVGLDALDNDSVGRVGEGAPLRGSVVQAARAHLAAWPTLHRAQVSVVYPGYPRHGDSGRR